MVSSPKYSICIANYNMADTIERALVSVLTQLDANFEVVVVDDGSTDTSVKIVTSLMARYSALRMVALRRNRRRMLGETRNISVRAAQGEYVLLHVDADDIWQPYINAFVQIFHRIEAQLGRDYLLSGQQLNMARRSFLLSHGPYRNTQLGEDRDLWLRMAAINCYFPLDHVVFRERLARPQRISMTKALRGTWHRTIHDFRSGARPVDYVGAVLSELFKNEAGHSLRARLLRTLLVAPGLIASRFYEPLGQPAAMRTAAQFADYRERTRGTYGQIMKRLGGDPDLSFLAVPARRIFASKMDSE